MTDWGQVATEQWPALVAYARAIDPVDPDGAVGEAFARVLEGGHDPANPTTWIRGVVRRIARNARYSGAHDRERLEAVAPLLLGQADETLLVDIKRCRAQGYKRRPRKRCGPCGELFDPGHVKQETCSVRCGQRDRVRHDPEVRAQIVALYAAGVTVRTIAEETDRNPSQVYLHLERAGVPRSRRSARSIS